MAGKIEFGEGVKYLAPTPRLSSADFDALVESAWQEIHAELPPAVREAIADIEIGIEDECTPGLDGPSMVRLGQFMGPSIQEAAGARRYPFSWPRSIMLFQRPIELVANRERISVRDKVTVVLLHELGHALGYDHPALTELGVG